MADLDDFFAKKDKKKSKAKPKFLTADELVKNLEDTTKRELATKPKKSESVATPALVNDGTTAVEGTTKVDEEQPTEEEWKEFEEEQRKDYSGLKIGQLTINDDDDQSICEADDDDGDSDYNINSDTGKRTGGGPWRKVVPAEEVTQIPIEVEKKVYITPALRQGALTGPGSRIKSRKTAPDITNADYFPTLGAARPEEQRKKRNEPAFEEVRHGGRILRIPESTLAPPSATNRFQSLDEDDS